MSTAVPALWRLPAAPETGKENVRVAADLVTIAVGITTSVAILYRDTWLLQRAAIRTGWSSGTTACVLVGFIPVGDVALTVLTAGRGTHPVPIDVLLAGRIFIHSSSRAWNFLPGGAAHPLGFEPWSSHKFLTVT